MAKMISLKVFNQDQVKMIPLIHYDDGKLYVYNSILAGSEIELTQELVNQLQEMVNDQKCRLSDW